jgi:hypothetical protein
MQNSIGFANDSSLDLELLRVRLRNMPDADLMLFGEQMRELVYPLTYDFRSEPSVSAFSIQLLEARAGWRRRRVDNRGARDNDD